MRVLAVGYLAAALAWTGCGRVGFVARDAGRDAAAPEPDAALDAPDLVPLDAPVVRDLDAFRAPEPDATADAPDPTDAPLVVVDAPADGGGCGPCPCASDVCVGGGCRPAHSARRLATGSSHTCALVEGGALYCWGNDGSGQLGLGRSGDVVEPPTLVPGGLSFAHIYASFSTTCGVSTAGALYCWGDGSSGQLGLGDLDPRTTPTRVGTDADWRTVSLSQHNACGTRVDGTLHCWGANESGQLGLGAGALGMTMTTPQRVGLDTDWTDVAAGWQFACGRRAGASLWCWGENGSGRLGLGDFTSRPEPSQVGSSRDWVALSSGDHNGCAINRAGELHCWGGNFLGQVGVGIRSDAVHEPNPQRVQPGSAWTNVSVGIRHTCAIRSDGTLHCWGWNLSGMLGTGLADEHVTMPARVGSATDWVEVMTGMDFRSCARRLDGRVFCWGPNDRGELGVGDTLPHTEPTEVCLP